MKAIETMYAGTLFRSRLEARWAVFFDELGIKWEFEPEGYVVGLSDPIADADRTVHYLPDFYLPNTETWVEVKGDEDRLDRDLLCAASDYGQGLPGTDNSLGTKRGILVLGPIPRPGSLYGHPLIQHRKGVYLNRAIFTVGGFDCFEINEWFGDGAVGADYVPPLLEPIEYEFHDDPAVSSAYSAARSARFEHSHREVWSTASR